MTLHQFDALSDAGSLREELPRICAVEHSPKTGFDDGLAENGIDSLP
jgi:hypothetical protein